jgi:hypothetical protein
LVVATTRRATLVNQREGVAVAARLDKEAKRKLPS